MAMPPPREYPTREKPPDAAPVHDSDDEAAAKKIWAPKSLASWGTPSGVSVYPLPQRSLGPCIVSDMRTSDSKKSCNFSSCLTGGAAMPD